VSRFQFVADHWHAFEVKRPAEPDDGGGIGSVTAYKARRRRRHRQRHGLHNQQVDPGRLSVAAR
jgi:hypothetical protein